MRKFTDDCNREWNVHITCASLKRITAHAGFDIADVSNGKAVDLFGGNSTNLLDILWPLVKAAAEKQEIDYDSFGDGLRGDAVERATAVLKEELLDFFPQSRRNLMARLLARMDKIVMDALEKASRDIEAAPLPSEVGGMLPTSAPELSASTQTSGPSES